MCTKQGKCYSYPLLELCNDRNLLWIGNHSFYNFVKSFDLPGLKILDVGGRDRSKLDRSVLFKSASVTVLDILPGDNVDVVGDAHKLDSLFPENYFDAVFSASVFEHLMMPWAVITKLNYIMKTDALVYISTHQSLGMHDIPWDFWRFSDTAWDALLNQYTGFQILDRGLEYPMYLLPFIYRKSMQFAEKSAGFESSWVIAKKISHCQMSWNLDPNSLVKNTYPNVDDCSDRSELHNLIQ